MGRVETETGRRWQALHRQAEGIGDRRILDLLAQPGRAEAFSLTAGDLLLDYSKTQIDEAIRAELLALIDASGMEARRAQMFAGEAINVTEGRAVLHTALRNLHGDPVTVAGKDIMPEVRATLARMEAFADAIRQRACEFAGGPVRDVVNIGIGGSDLGPRMAVEALAPWHDGPRVHFISNVDGADAHDRLKGLDPAQTLVIVTSKTFTTIETMTNAETLRDWMRRGGVSDPAAQFVAVSSALERTRAFGIPPERVFGFGDWVGGRYSLWGPVGLALMLAIGPRQFRALLSGAAAMDAHFRSAPLAENMPVALAMTGLWHNQVLGYASRAVLPYDQRLARLPAYLQQLEMESNGKSVAMDGSALQRDSGPLVWGAPGTDGQHAFFQLLHQGTRVVPCEFMIAARGHEPELRHHHELLLVNCLAQSEALMRGRDLESARKLAAALGYSGAALEMQARHRVFPGNRPSVTLAYPRLTPHVLGQVIALYEHRVFVEGVVLGINSFDQWGVELGKELALSLKPALGDAQARAEKDASTRHLLDFLAPLPGRD